MDQINNIAAATIETPAEKERSRLRLWAMLVALAKAILRFVRRMFGLATETATELRGNAADAVDTARRGVEATGRVVGRGLSGPARVLDATASAVGNTLGAILPQRPVTPADVARGAVARDDRREASVAAAVPAEVAEGPAPAPLLTTEHLVKLHAAAAHFDPTGRRAEGLIPLDDRLAAWLLGLTIDERRRVASASERTIARHLYAMRDDERILGVAPVPGIREFDAARAKVDRALSLLQAAPGRPALSRADAFRTIGVGELGDEPEDSPVARFGR